jgi:elongation factor Ts
MIEAKQVMELRQKTLLPINKCKEALENTNGNMDKALVWLKEKGTKFEIKDRKCNAGYIAVYQHQGNQICSMVELACETDFVAQNQLFRDLGTNIAMQVAFALPEYISENNVEEEKEKEIKETAREKAISQNKPKKAIHNIVDGAWRKWLEENTLENQKYLKNDKLTISELIKETAFTLGETVRIKNVTVMKVGVGVKTIKG